MNNEARKNLKIIISSKDSEKKIQARAVSRGIAVGSVICLHGDKRQFYKIDLTKGMVEREVRRFRAAVRLARRHLTKLIAEKSFSETQKQIFESHSLILEDAGLIGKVESIIETERVNAEWAVKLVTDDYLSIYKNFKDEHLRDRSIDLQDVTERLLLALGGSSLKRNQKITVKTASIIVAKEVKPSTLIELSQENVKGIITESGGWTSHTFILSRELNLPAITGAKGILRRVKTGDQVIVDGFNGQIVLHPKKETLREYKNSAQNNQVIKPVENEINKGQLQTLDKREILIYANLDISKDYALAKKHGAVGIGLFRSEYFFKQAEDFPSETAQVEAYRKIALVSGAAKVKIRTFDLTADQISSQKAAEKNPALGLRAIRLSMANEKQFRIQLRSMLQASSEKQLDVVLPMISDVSEIRMAKRILTEEKTKLSRKKIPFGECRIGVMIEVPSALLMIDEIAEEADFMNLGTNDLVQYLLAVDRDNETVADWFRTLHPAVLRAIKKIVVAADKCGKELIVCGEMAGSPYYVPILIGLGATKLSMNVNSIHRVRPIIAAIAYEEAREIVSNLQICRTAQEIEEKVQTEFNSKWSHLFPSDVFQTKLR